MKKILTFVVAVLLSSSVVSVFAEDTTAFVNLCKTAGINTIKSAISNGADVNSTLQDGTTALMSACQNKTSSAVNIVTTLLSSGANINAVNSLGKTAFDYAKTNTKYGKQITALLEKAKTTINSAKNSTAATVASTLVSSTTVKSGLKSLFRSK